MCVNFHSCEAVETCLLPSGKEPILFPLAVNGFPIGVSGRLPHFHNATGYPTGNRYTVSGTYHAATIRHQPRAKPPITPPMIKFKAKREIPPPRGSPPGTIQGHIRYRPKGKPQSIQSYMHSRFLLFHPYGIKPHWDGLYFSAVSIRNLLKSCASFSSLISINCEADFVF